MVPAYNITTTWTRPMRHFDNVITALWVLYQVHLVSLFWRQQHGVHFWVVQTWTLFMSFQGFRAVVVLLAQKPQLTLCSACMCSQAVMQAHE